MEGGMKIWRLSTNVSLYFENGTRYGHSSNGRRMETRIRSTANGVIFNDLKRPVTHNSRLRQ